MCPREHRKNPKNPNKKREKVKMQMMQKNDDGLFYKPAIAPGYAQMKEKTVADYVFPHGPVWRGEEKARLPRKRQVEEAEAVLAREGIAPHQKMFAGMVAVAATAVGYYFLSTRKK